MNTHLPNSEDRGKTYLADMTYGSNKEFAFRYLRGQHGNNLGIWFSEKHH
jgi:preprotein translocase subunit SecA